MLHHKGYRGRIEFDDQTRRLHGEVLDTHGMITFEGRSVDEVEASFREAVDDYLAFCAERGEEPEEPMTERLVLDVPKSLHDELSVAAQREGKSISQWVADRLAGMI